MDFNIEVRKKQLESLNQYITASKLKVQSFLDNLNWTSKKVLEEDNKTICAINPGHIVPTSKLNEHLQDCYVRIQGYTINEQFLSEPAEPSPSSIKLDYLKKIEVLREAAFQQPAFRPGWNGQDLDGMTSDRLMATLSPDERLAIYNFAIKNTEKPPEPPEFNTATIDQKDEERELTYEEVLAKQRDLKRRRIKYKSVHTKRKSQTEIMKEVIENQMDLYKDWLRAKQSKLAQKDCFPNGTKEEIERPHSSTSRYSSGSKGTKRRSEESRERKGSREYSDREYKERDKSYKSSKEYYKDDHRNGYRKHGEHRRHREKSPYREKERDWSRHRSNGHYNKERHSNR